MNGLILKCIALVTMLIDHTGAILFPQYLWMRIIGRMAFPIYCYLLIEGYMHTKSIKKYLMRLCIFAFISEIPFDLAFHGRILSSGSNVFFTLFLGLFAVYASDYLGLKYSGCQLMGYGAFVISGALAVLMNTDYDYRGVLLICIFYIFKHHKAWQFALSALLFGTINWIQMFGLLAFIPIFLYNGKRGPDNKALSRIFYWFYPVHIFILYGILCWV